MRRSTYTPVLFLVGIAVGGCDPALDEPESKAGAVSDLDALLADRPSNDDLPFDIKADAPPPRSFTELLETQTPVRNQAQRGVCSIFSTTALMEHLYLAGGGPALDLSEQYLQWSVKAQLGAFTDQEGSNPKVNIEAISRFGLPAEQAWPYQRRGWTASDDPACGGDRKPLLCFTNGAPPAEAFNAEKHTLGPGRSINSARESIIDHIQTTKTAVTVDLEFFAQAWSHGSSALPTDRDYSRNGYVPYPNPTDIEESRQERAGHSVLVVGWDSDLEIPMLDPDGEPLVDAQGRPVLDKGFFIFKNSWGTGWAPSNPHGPGYGFLSMRYVEEFGKAFTAVTPNGAPGGHSEVFSNSDVVDIPDVDPTGITSTIDVPTSGPIQTLLVRVVVAHQGASELGIKLTHADFSVWLSQSSEPGVFVYEASRPPYDRGGPWTIQVSDFGPLAVGQLRGWSVAFD